MTEMIVSYADISIICLSQNMKHLAKIKEHGLFTSHPALAEKDVAVVVTRYSELPYLDIKQIGKFVNCDAMFTLSEDVGIHQNFCQCTVMDFVQALYKKQGGFSELRKKRGSEITASELDALVRAIYSIRAGAEAKREEGA